jgi:hypothetical protein
MNKFRFTLKIAALATFLFAFASLAQAQATRTWVSGVGDDVNPCSRTAPCKTFAGAISKTAAGGEIDCLDPGGFGAVTITKNLTIDGTHGSGFGSILASATNGVNVNDSATGSPNTIVVTLRKLSINGAGTTLGVNGINFTSGKRVNVENCEIFNFSNSGINASLNHTSPTGSTLNVLDTKIWNTGTKGILVKNTGASSFATAIITNTAITLATDGVRLETGGHATMNGCVITFCTTAGVNLVSGQSGMTANIINSVVNSNGTGLISNNFTTRIGGSTFIENATPISMTVNQVVKTFGTNNIEGTITGGSLGLTPPQ